MTGGTVDRTDERYSRGIRRRVALLTAALRVAERSGIAEVGLRSVARECDVGPSLVSYHFPDRTALLRALARYTAAQFEARASTATGGSADRAELLAAVVADASSLNRGRALVEYELALLGTREDGVVERDLGWPRLLAETVRHAVGEPVAAMRAVDEIEGLRFRAVTGPRRLRARDVQARIEQILVPRRTP